MKLLTVSLNDSVIPRELRRDVLTMVSASDPILAWQFFRNKYSAYFEVGMVYGVQFVLVFEFEK